MGECRCELYSISEWGGRSILDDEIYIVQRERLASVWALWHTISKCLCMDGASGNWRFVPLKQNGIRGDR